jgi:hypothetical protein
MYFVFFVVVGAASYGLIVTTASPTVALDGPSYGEGDEVALGDRTFTVSGISASSEEGEITRSGELTWVNESGQLSTTLDNGSTVPPTDAVWEGQQARNEATLSGSTAAYNGSEYDLTIEDGSFTLTNPDNATDNATFESGDTIEYQGNEATVTEIGSDEVTLVWGNEYLVHVANATDPSEFTLIEQRNVTALAAEDTALYDQTVTVDGVEYVTYRDNDTNVPVQRYFGEVERHTVAENSTFQYQGNETTVDSITTEAVTLVWSGSQTTTIDLEEGANATVDGQQYFAHFPDNSTVQILSTNERYGDYSADNQRIDAYEGRMTGLWAVFDISLFAAIILLATAYLPVRG